MDSSQSLAHWNSNQSLPFWTNLDKFCCVFWHFSAQRFTIMAEDVFIVIMNKNWQYNLFPLQHKYWINLVWPFPEAGFDRHSVFMHLFDSAKENIKKTLFFRLSCSCKSPLRNLQLVCYQLHRFTFTNTPK